MKKINLSFFVLLIFFVQVIFSDTIIYFFDLSYGISNIIAVVMNILPVSLVIRKKLIKIEISFNKWDSIFLGILLIIMALTIFFPDTSWDSYSYHIYLQERPFADKINNDFFPGRTLTSFVFPIVDRVFFMFRNLLGFRLGTLPNYLVLIVIFYQCKKILNKLLKEKIKQKYISILSIIPLLNFIILNQIGTYYIDNFSITVLLEFVYIILYETEDIFKNKPRLYYLAFIVGIATCVKITNIIYILVPLLYLVIKNFKNIKQIKWYDYILLIITLILPILPYVLDAIIQTGSPVFPYYNTIFKSKYFEEKNWIDARYGPENIIQLLLWPIYIAKYPQKAYELGKTDSIFYIGYIVVIVNLFYLCYKKIIKKEKIDKTIFVYNAILIYFYLVWAKFIIGYTRYAGIILVIGSLLILKILVEEIMNKRRIKTIIIMISIILSLLLGCYQYFYHGTLSCYSIAIKGNVKVNNKIKRNIKKVYIDRNNEKYDIDGVWGVICDDSAIPLLLNVDDRLVQLEYGDKTGRTLEAESIYWNNILNNDIYIPITSLNFKQKLEYLDIFDFEIKEIVHTMSNVSFFVDDTTIYIVRVEYNKNREIPNEKNFGELKSK